MRVYLRDTGWSLVLTMLENLAWAWLETRVFVIDRRVTHLESGRTVMQMQPNISPTCTIKRNRVLNACHKLHSEVEFSDKPAGIPWHLTAKRCSRNFTFSTRQATPKWNQTTPPKGKTDKSRTAAPKGDTKIKCPRHINAITELNGNIFCILIISVNRYSFYTNFNSNTPV